MDSPSDRGPRPGPSPVLASHVGADLEQRDRVLDRMRTTIRARYYSPRTEKAYVGWAARFLGFCEPRPAESLGAADVARFLTHLATKGRVSASTQNQAFSALLFLLQDTLGRELGDVRDVVRAKRPVRVPLVLSRGEVAAILGAIQGTPRLMAQLMYGAGLRLLECCRLRVKDVDFARNEITVRDGKGRKDRRTVLPGKLVEPLRAHLERVRRQHELDLAGGAGSVALPDALDAKYVNARLGVGLAVGLPCGAALRGPRDWPPPPAPRPRERGAAGVRHRRARQPPHEARHVPHPPALLRHAPARGWLRHPDHPGAPRPPRRGHHDDLHSRPEPRRTGREEPPRWRGLAFRHGLAAVIRYPRRPFPYRIPVYSLFPRQIFLIRVEYSVFGRP